MGCDCCHYSNYGETPCTAPKIVRRGFCGVEDVENTKGNKYTKPKKRRRKKWKTNMETR